MAVTAPAPISASRRPRLFWSRLHFVIRLLGLTGGLLACAAAVLAAVQGELRTLQTATVPQQAWTAGVSLAQTAWQAPQQNLAVILCLAGAATALFTLLVELLVVLAFTATRRSAFGFNAVVQGVLAAVALIGVNLWSFHHAAQVDFTRDRQFTLPAEVRKDLAQMHPNSPTTIIVYNRHKVFALAQEKDKPEDDYDKEAQRKVIEKVHDLVEQFRALGRQFNVEVLDTESKDYKFTERLQGVTLAAARDARAGEPADDKQAQEIEAQIQTDAETLRQMIKDAPENSLFFCGRENQQFHVQHLSFNDFYLLDKTLSEDDRGGRGNLVLLYQGVEPFARRLLKLGEKKPRIAIATIHEVLSTGSEYDMGLASLRKALETRGFDVTDIVLKKENKDTSRLEPAVYSLEETKLERLKREESVVRQQLVKLQSARTAIEKERDFWAKAADDEKMRTSFLKQLAEQAPDQARQHAQDVQEIDLKLRQIRQVMQAVDNDVIRARLQRELEQSEEEREQFVELRDLWQKAIRDSAARETLLRRIIKQKADDYTTDLERIDQAVRRSERQLEQARNDKAKLNVRALEEQQQMSDLRAKLRRLLADCDLLIVPRMTLRNTAAGFPGLRPRYYPLEAEQVAAIKEFLRAGKPILACFGPLNWPQEDGGNGEPDGLENLFTELGIKMLKQTVLYDVEEKAFAENRAGLSIAGSSVEVPPLIWDWSSRDSLPPGSPDLPRPASRIRDSVRLTARGLGKDQTLELRIRDPRPVYFVPPEPPGLRTQAVALFASPAQPSWPGLTLSLTALGQSLEQARQQLHADPVFLMTSSQSWNEDNPFPSDDRIPQFEQPKSDKDNRRRLKPAAGGLETRRRGPFPIGVAVETTVPRSWYASEADKRARLRLAVIGQGGFFTGNDKQKLPGAEEKVLVHTINWLLGRDDRLPHDERVWSYPRVNDTIPPDSPTEYLWLWGVRLGLPALFAYFGLVVLLFRRLR
ncbi:MAG TPA: hypothetical protein VMG10_20145 [Gemmataceae bacterium]|nr:hypothetical protein [Gemmataceae bacterium]